MPTPADARDRLAHGALTTASPARLVVLCFERIDRDLASALTGLGRRDNERVNRELCHAQELISVLLESLDREVWEHADRLASIYEYTLNRLVAANIAKDAGPINEVRGLLAPIGDAFREAERTVATAARQSTTFAPAAGEGRLSVKA
jgi:flagellar secretion chaperone FliS